MPQLRDSSGIKAFSSSFLQRSIILSISNIVKHYLHVCLSVSAPVVWLRCRRNNIFSLLVCLCPGGGWAGLGWAGRGWAGLVATIQHSSVLQVLSPALLLVASDRGEPQPRTQSCGKQGHVYWQLGKPICLMPVCRILNQTKESKCAQIKQLPTVSSGVHSCGKNIYPLVIVVPVMINKNKTAPNKQNFFAADSQGCQKRHCWKINNKNQYDCLWCPAAVVQCWECSSQTICLFLSIS